MSHSFSKTILSALAALSLASAAPARAAELAKVNGKPVTDKDVNQALSHLNEGMRANVLKDKNTRHEIVNQLIDQELLVQAAEKEKVDQDPEYKDAVNAFRRQFLANKTLTKDMNGKLGDDAVKKYYESHKSQFSTDQVHAMHILVKDEALAKDLIKKAKAKDADFQALAEKYSQDPSAKNNRGDLDFFGRGQMVAEFTEAAFTGKPGEIVPNPVKTAFGYHVIKVIEKKSGKPLTFLDVEGQVRNQLRQELAQTALGKLRAKAKIETDDAAIDKM